MVVSNYSEIFFLHLEHFCSIRSNFSNLIPISFEHNLQMCYFNLDTHFSNISISKIGQENSSRHIFSVLESLSVFLLRVKLDYAFGSTFYKDCDIPSSYSYTVISIYLYTQIYIFFSVNFSEFSNIRQHL